MIRVSLIAATFVAITAGAAAAQEQVMAPLADVARQAEAAKANVKKAKKTYTNASLSADPRGDTTATVAPAAATAPVAAPGAPGEKTAATASPAAAKAEGEQPTESEASWRARATSVRTQVDRLRGRLEELTIPNPLRDENPGVKAANDIETANARKALDGMRRQWTRIEAQALERKIPMAWIQPQPVFPQ